MKKSIRLLVVLGVLGPALSAGEKFSIRVSYGAAKVAPSDLNSFLTDQSRWLSDLGYTVSGEGLKTVGWSDEFEVGLFVPISARLSVFVSVGLIGAERLANEFVFSTAYGSWTDARNDRLRAAAGRLGVAYALPLSGALTLRPHISLDGYWSSFQDDGSQSFQTGGGEPQTEMGWSANAKAFNIGATLGFGLDAAIWSKLSLSIDAGWRSARLSGFEGKYQETDFNSPPETRNFSLLFSRIFSDWSAATYGVLNLPQFPGGVVREVRDAVLDMSGVYATAGIKISF